MTESSWHRAVAGEALDIYGVVPEEVVAGGDTHRDGVGAAGQGDRQAVEHEVHVHFAAAAVLPDFAEDEFRERGVLVGLRPEYVLQRLVDVSRVDDRIGVRRNRKQRIGFLLIARLCDESGRFDHRVVSIRLDPLVRVRVLVGDRRLDCSWQLADGLREGRRFVGRRPAFVDRKSVV